MGFLELPQIELKHNILKQVVELNIKNCWIFFSEIMQNRMTFGYLIFLSLYIFRIFCRKCSIQNAHIFLIALQIYSCGLVRKLIAYWKWLVKYELNWNLDLNGFFGFISHLIKFHLYLFWLWFPENGCWTTQYVRKTWLQYYFSWNRGWRINNV